jgi:hypothetical protein
MSADGFPEWNSPQLTEEALMPDRGTCIHGEQTT